MVLHCGLKKNSIMPAKLDIVLGRLTPELTPRENFALVVYSRDQLAPTLSYPPPILSYPLLLSFVL